MVWVCSKCGRTINAPPGRKVFCSCGSIKEYPIEAFRAAGRKAWGLIHSYPITYWDRWDPEAARLWYSNWLANVPQYGCNCSAKWAKLTKDFPPDFSSPEAFFRWTVDRHNDVNESLGSMIVGIDEAFEIWSDTRFQGVGSTPAKTV